MKFFNSLIDSYAQTHLKSEGDKTDFEVAKDAFRSVIIEEIKAEYGESIRAQVKRDVEEEYKVKQQQKRVMQVKKLFVESVFVATFVGLMVNQATDIITYMKQGQSKVIYITLFIIFLLIGVLFYYIKFIYIDKVSTFLEEYLKKKR